MALTIGLVAAACQTRVPLASSSTTFGNIVTAFDNPATPTCPQFQSAPACGPVTAWAAINGPYELHANGDPYATKCTTTGLPGSPANCDDPAAPNGAKNPDYRATGYAYAIDVSAADEAAAAPLVVRVWDVGSYARTVGSQGTNSTAWITAGSTTVTISTSGAQFAGYKGWAISGTGIPAGATIVSLSSATQATISVPATSTGTNRTITWTPVNVDCSSASPPFTGTFPPGFGTSNCQTGDSGGGNAQSGVNMDLQVYENDGKDHAVDYGTPRPGCHLQVLAATPNTAATYKNKWATFCTIDHPRKGIYPLRVRNSGLTGITDSGRGTNAFALAVQGASSSRLYALGDASLWFNQPGNSQVGLYLAEIGPANAGKKLQIDLYDPGDSSGAADFTLQILAPPGGSPSPAPSGGVAVPAAGIATTCTYNAAPSATKGPATPDTAPNCRVLTHSAAGANVYNDNWLRIEVQLDPAYTCGPATGGDCWWTLRYDFGGTNALTTDRVVYSVKVV